MSDASGGNYVIPKRWVTFRGSVYADALQVKIMNMVRASGSVDLSVFAHR